MNLFGSTYTRLLRKLHEGAMLSYSSIASLFKITERQAQRLIKRVQTEGHSLTVQRIGRRKYFSIPEERRETGIRIDINHDEILALVVASNAVDSPLGPTPLGPALHSAVSKLLRELPGDFYITELHEMKEQWHFSSTPTANINLKIFRALMQSVEECHTLAITYFTAKRKRISERKIDPYGFAAPKGSWMVVAWCHHRRQFLNFSIADIRTAKPCPEEFFLRKTEFNLHNHFAGQFGGMGGEQMYDVTLLIEPDRLPAFRRKQYHASQELQELEDGRGIVRFRVAGLEDIRAFAQSWGIGVTVLEPEELVEVIREEAMEIVEKHKIQRTDLLQKQ